MSYMPPIEIKGWNRDRAIAGIVKATFPNYKRQKVYIRATESVTLSDLNWSGGTRSEYRACTLDGQQMGDTARFSQCAPWENPAEGLNVPVPAGHVVVRGGHFCGKESILTLHVNPTDMPKYLPNPAASS